jgi:DNA mismatch repair protein MutS
VLWSRRINFYFGELNRTVHEPIPDKTPPSSKNAAVTPMMTQFLAIKREHPEGLLFYRMGDFYELFFDDAVQAAEALDITLTKRGKHLGEDIPMCGVPVHSHETYLQRLIRKGFKVCVCEQSENPAEAKKRGNKSVVRRDVVRVVTPGTLTEDTLLDARRHNYLAACAGARGGLGLAWIDVSTGDFHTQPVAAEILAAALTRIAPGELLVSDKLIHKPELFDVFGGWSDKLSPLPAARFDSTNGRKRLESLFDVTSLDGFGDFTLPEVAAAGALIDYVELTQKGRLPRIGRLQRLRQGAVMEIDAATRRNLELTETLSGERQGCLVNVVDRTVTGAGARLLASRMAAPLTDVAVIDARLDLVRFFVDSERLRGDVRTHLKQCPDVERALSRLTLDRGGPRDLAGIKTGLALTAELRTALEAGGLAGQPHELEQCLEDLGFHGKLVDRLTRALAPGLPIYARDGGFIAEGYSAELDEFRTLRDESRRLIAGLQAGYVSQTGVSTLKVKHNNVLGYFIEVPAKQGDNVPAGANDPFIHRQTLANAVRFTTVELGELETKIARAADRAVALELGLFEDLVNEVKGRVEQIALAANALARLDVGAALAELAVDERYCRPQLSQGTEFEIVDGRHPVVEVALKQMGQSVFVANSCDLATDGQLWLLTGPNMAGKSTFLRQNALIAILAQMGAYVPAASAKIGIVDRLFSRVGAADDLARGQSTFMVEMVETAAILHQATERSLVILDEIGRGTATFDGLSIAWAVVEHLHEVNKSRALFATHYHELTALADKLDGLACHTMRVKEWQGDVVFLHEVGAGAADRSYGIHVGKLAGLPVSVVSRSRQILEIIEKGEQSATVTRLADDLPLFAVVQAEASHVSALTGPSPVEEELRDISADELTPREALDLIYCLKGLLSD